MDRQISKERLVKERKVKIYKWSGGVGAFVVIILLISLFMEPSVRAESLLISKADRGSIELSVTAQGKIVPAFEEIISSPIDSRVVEVYKKGGDSLEVGTPILKLDLMGAESAYKNMVDQEQMKVLELDKFRINNAGRISQMEMNLKVQKMELNRKEVNLRNEKYLDSLGSGTADKVREAELGYNVAVLQLGEDEQKLINERQLIEADQKVKTLELSIFRKELAQVKRTYEDARILSPRKGVLTFVVNEIGAQVGRGTKVAIVSDLTHFKVEGEISDTYAAKIGVGYKAVVKLGKEKYAATVSNLTPLSRNGMLAFSVKLDNDDNRALRPGLSGDVYVLNSIKDDAIRIQNGDYYKGAGDYNMYVKEGETLYLRTIKLGECNFEFVEVISGVNEGEEIVVGGQVPSGKKRLKLK